MSFLHEALIENTSEAMEWLESLGYKRAKGGEDNKSSKWKIYLHTFNMWVTNAPIYATNVYDCIPKGDGVVDCRGNLSLFKAVTALRDDSDYKQWFKIPKSEFNKHKFSTRTLLEIDNCTYLACADMNVVNKDGGVYKATLEELLQHFKK